MTGGMVDAARPDRFVEYRLVRLADRLERRFAATLAPHGLTPRQFSALFVLVSSPGTTSAALARSVLTTAQGMHTLVEQLERRGLVERGERGRGRPAPVRVTDAGHALLGRATSDVRALDERARALLGEDYDRLAAILDRLEADGPRARLGPDGPGRPDTAERVDDLRDGFGTSG